MQPTEFRPGRLQDLRDFDCHIWRYSPSLSRLMLRLLKGDIVDGETHFVVFTSVEFFSGVMGWKGCELSFGTPEEALSIVAAIRGLDYRQRSAGPQLGSSPRLYLFDDKAKILCSGALLYHDLPEL